MKTTDKINSDIALENQSHSDRLMLLEEENRILREMYNFSDNYIAIIDAKCNLIYFNSLYEKAFYSQFHKKLQIKMNLKDILPIEYQKNLDSIVYRVLKGEIVTEDYILEKEDGSQVYYNYYLKKSESNSNYVLLKIKDVSIEAEAQKQILNSNNHYKNLINALSELLFIFDKNGKINNLHLGNDEIIKESEKNLINHTIYEVFPKDFAINISAEFDDIILLNKKVSKIETVKINDIIYSYDIQISKYSNHEILLIARDITKQSKMEEELKFNSMLLNQIQDQIFVTDLNNNIIFANQSLSLLLGKSLENIIGENIIEFSENALNGTRFDEMINELITTGSSQGTLYFGDSIENKKIIEIKAWSLKNLLGETSGYIYVSNDITEQKIIEYKINEQKDALKTQNDEIFAKNIELINSYDRLITINNKLIQSENLLKSIINNSTSAISLKDTTGRYILVNSKFEKLFKINAEDCIGKTAFDLFDLKVAEEAYKSILKVIETNESVQNEELIFYNNSYHTYLTIRYPIMDSNNNLSTIGCISTDISYIKEAQEAVKNSEETLQAILSASPVGIAKVINRQVIWANQAMLDIFGYSKEDSLENCISKVYFSDKHFEEFGDEIYNELYENKIVKREVKWIRSDGNLRDYLFMLSPIDINDKNEGQISVIMDITESKQLEEERRLILEMKIEAEQKKNEALKVIEQASRLASIGVIAGGITHEINQPLNAIKMAASGILFWNQHNKFILPTMVSKLITDIGDSTKNIEEIIKQMRSYWIDIDVKKFDVCDLNNSVSRASSLIEKRAKAHDIELILELSDCEVNLLANNVHLELIITNLITNSINSLDKSNYKNKWIKLKTYKDTKSRKAIFEIIDNGIGLPQTNIEQLFDPFFSTNKNDGGTGLGLAIVKKFIDTYDAKINAESNNDGGATFILKFDLAERNA